MAEAADRRLGDLEMNRKRLAGITATLLKHAADECIAMNRYEKLRRWEFKLQAKL